MIRMIVLLFTKRSVRLNYLDLTYNLDPSTNLIFSQNKYFIFIFINTLLSGYVFYKFRKNFIGVKFNL